MDVRDEQEKKAFSQMTSTEGGAQLRSVHSERKLLSGFSTVENYDQR
jgi:hypothetical protein